LVDIDDLTTWRPLGDEAQQQHLMRGEATQQQQHWSVPLHQPVRSSTPPRRQKSAIPRRQTRGGGTDHHEEEDQQMVQRLPPALPVREQVPREDAGDQPRSPPRQALHVDEFSPVVEVARRGTERGAGAGVMPSVTDARVMRTITPDEEDKVGMPCRIYVQLCFTNRRADNVESRWCTGRVICRRRCQDTCAGDRGARLGWNSGRSWYLRGQSQRSQPHPNCAPPVPGHMP
jgi:hypothetical protein